VKRDRAVNELLQLIAENREARCRVERERAAAEARAVVRQAHASARARLRTVVEQASSGPRERLARAEAQHRTRERLAHQRRVQARLEQGLRLVRELLERAWLDPTERSGWIERAAQRALEVLPGGRWDVTHAPALPEAERERLRQLLLAKSVRDVEFASAAGAGVKFASGSAVFDATLEGLLGDRAAIEARLLFHLGGARP
jgi:hypothetical protein